MCIMIKNTVLMSFSTITCPEAPESHNARAPIQTRCKKDICDKAFWMMDYYFDYGDGDDDNFHYVDVDDDKDDGDDDNIVQLGGGKRGQPGQPHPEHRMRGW